MGSKQQSSFHRLCTNKDDFACMDRRECPHELLMELENKLPSDPESWRKLLILKSAITGNVDQLKAILATCPNSRDLVNSQDLSGCTSLHAAARFNKVAVAELLLTHGADCNKAASTHSTALAVACRFQNEEIVRLLLKNGGNPCEKLKKGGNVMHVIALHSTVSIAELVFGSDSTPPVNSVDDFGMTPLHNAAQIGKADVCLWLLRHGANPRATDLSQMTPLMAASRFGHVNVMRAILVFYGIDVQQKESILRDVDDEGMAALHYAVLGGCYEAVNELLVWGADTNARNVHSMSPLHTCAVDGFAMLVPLLASYQAHLSLQDDKGRTALHRAVEYRNIEVLTALLAQGADPNIQDTNYTTPLQAACLIGYTEAVEKLCEHGADMTITNFYGQTCLHSAVDFGSLQVLMVLLERCGEKSPVLTSEDIFSQTVLHVAAKQVDAQFVNELLNRGCSATARNVSGGMPLHVAARYGSHETVLRLAEVTPDVNAQCTDGKSALFLACEFGNKNAMYALLSKGANVEDTDIQIRNCLMTAAIGGFTDMVVDLIKLGVQVNFKDKERNTALHHACLHGRLSTVQALLDHGACVSDLNIRGLTPLDLAVDKSMSDVAVMLMKHNSWEESLSVPNKKGRYIINRMVEKTPAAVKIVLDKCVRTSDHVPTDEAFAIEFSYKYINPGDNCTFDSECVFVTMLNNDREDLLSHPLCQSNLSYKWHTLGKAVFVSHAIMQLALLLCVSAFYMMMPKPHEADYMCRRTEANPVNHTHINNATTWAGFYHPRFRQEGMDILENILYSFMALQFLRDMYTLFAVGRQYLISLHFILSMTISSLVLFATMPPGFEPCDMQWRAISYALFVFFLKTSVMCQRLDSIGMIFTMFIEVAKTMMKISIIMMFFIFALAIPYNVMLNQEGFKEKSWAVMSTFAMGIGELNFRDNFITADNGPFEFDMYIMFPICCIILNFSLMNLMIGVAVGDISKVEKKAYLSRLRTHIYYLVEVEKTICPTRRLHMVGTKLVVRPNSKSRSFNEKVKRAFLYCEQINFIKNTDTRILTEQDKALAKELASQKASIEKLRKTTDDMMVLLQKIGNSCLDDRGDDNGLSQSLTSVKLDKVPELVG